MLCTLAGALALSTLAAAGAEPLRLSEALVLAGHEASAEQARLELARRQAQYLETLRKIQVELRPSLGLFAFSNPILLATNLGSGLSIGRRNAPSPLTLDNAWFDVVMAETAAEKAKVRAQMEAARAFYSLAEKQELARRSREALDVRRAHLAGVDRMVAAARVTALERISAEHLVVDAEGDVEENDAALGAAAMRLAALIGRPTETNLTVSDDAAPGLDAIPSPAVLLERAFQSRPDVDTLRRRLESLRRGAGGGRVQGTGVNLGYSYVGGVSGSGTRSGDTFLLGGNTGRVDLGFTLRLRNTGEKEAQRQVMEARAKLLEVEMESLARDIRTEVASLHAAVVAGAGRIRVAARKLALARKAEQMAAARAENGLAAAGSEFSFRQESLRAEADHRQAEFARRANWMALLVLCGFEDPAAGARSFIQAPGVPAPVASLR